MKFQRRQFLHLATGAAAVPAVSRLASAQTTYPSRPITMIVPLAAGGSVGFYRARSRGTLRREAGVSKSDNEKRIVRCPPHPTPSRRPIWHRRGRGPPTCGRRGGRWVCRSWRACARDVLPRHRGVDDRDPPASSAITVSRRRARPWPQAVLAALGLTEGRNVRIEYRFGAGDAESNRKYAAELLALAPDIMLASGASALMPLLRATRNVC
jgi:hypothetical protein